MRTKLKVVDDEDCSKLLSLIFLVCRPRDRRSPGRSSNWGRRLKRSSGRRRNSHHNGDYGPGYGVGEGCGAMAITLHRLSCARGWQNELPHRFGKALVLVAVGYHARLRLYLIAGVAHGNGKAALAKHEDVIRHVPHGGDLLGRNVQKPGQGSHDCSLVGLRVGNVEIIRLRARRARLLTPVSYTHLRAHETRHD